MPITRIRKFSTTDEIQAFLNGGVRGGMLRPAAYSTQPGGVAGASDLIGRTLTFTKPAPATVTFVAGDGAKNQPDPYFLSSRDIFSQIENALPGVKASLLAGTLLLQETEPSGGIALAAIGAGSYATLTGTQDLSTVDPIALEGKTLVLRSDGGGMRTTTFHFVHTTVAGANAASSIVMQINAAADGAAVTAQRDGANKLALRSNGAGTQHSVQVDGSSTALGLLGLTATTATGTATNTANEVLGLNADEEVTGQVYAPTASPVAAPMLLSISATNDGAFIVVTWE